MILVITVFGWAALAEFPWGGGWDHQPSPDLLENTLHFTWGSTPCTICYEHKSEELKEAVDPQSEDELKEQQLNEKVSPVTSPPNLCHFPNFAFISSAKVESKSVLMKII